METSIREALRNRAGGRCEYCHMPEQFSTLRFQQDHVIAQKHRGVNALENLAWSCPECNARKGSDLTGIDPVTGRLDRLFHPRLDLWDDHFQWNGPELVGKTIIGRITVALLQINREERIAVRKELMTSKLYPQS
jgi:hypothetical protein